MGLFDNDVDTSAAPGTGEIAVIPVLSESLTVHKTMADAGGVRVHKRIRSESVTIDEPLLKQTVEVTRTAIGREIDMPPPIRYEGDVTIVPVVEERLVMRRQLFLVEEVRMRRLDHTFHSPQEVSLRHEEVTVERQDMLTGAWRTEAAQFAAGGAANAGSAEVAHTGAVASPALASDSTAFRSI